MSDPRRESASRARPQPVDKNPAAVGSREANGGLWTFRRTLGLDPEGASLAHGGVRDLQPGTGQRNSGGLVDVLDRVLDKGLVIAGDIKVSLAEVELLTIRVRLLVCSIDKAQEIGLDWWKYDHHLVPGQQRVSAENEDLKKQVRALERRLAALGGTRARRALMPAPTRVARR